MESLGKQAIGLFMRAEIVRKPPEPEQKVQSVQTSHQETSAYEQAKAGNPTAKAPAGPPPEHPAASQPVRRDGEKVNRNDPCPCGSGEKYKKCCGR